MSIVPAPVIVETKLGAVEAMVVVLETRWCDGTPIMTSFTPPKRKEAGVSTHSTNSNVKSVSEGVDLRRIEASASSYDSKRLGSGEAWNWT